MARVLISYYKVQEIGFNKINCIWDGLIKEFAKNGNDVFAINTAYFNPYMENAVKNKKTNSFILSKAKEFNPEVIITFNHKIPQCILDEFKDIPIIIWDGDHIEVFSNLNYIKENIDRYKLFTITKAWQQEYLDFGFNSSQITYMPIATSVNPVDIEQDKNISFLGIVHYISSGKLINTLKQGKDNDLYSKILQDYLNNDNYDYKLLFRKYFKERYDDFNYTELDLHPLFNMRLITLCNLLDLGLQINGNRWELVTNLLPQLKAVYSPELIWTSDECEKYYNASKISINPIHPQGKGIGFSWRVFDIMASNACLVCEKSSDLKNLTKNYLDVPMYKTPWEAREVCKELLNNEKTRKEIVSASQKFINETSRWVHRFKRMEAFLDIKLTNLEKEGDIYILKDDHEFLETIKEEKIKPKDKLKLKNRLRLKVYKHLEKILKRKGII